MEKELKESDYYTPKNVYINTQYLLEIIEQAERVNKLEELIKDYKTINKELHDRRKKLRKQNKRYREALEFYADEE